MINMATIIEIHSIEIVACKVHSTTVYMNMLSLSSGIKTKRGLEGNAFTPSEIIVLKL